MSNVRPTLIAYTTKTKGFPEFEQFRVTFSNPTFFQRVAPQGKYDYFYTESAEIREAYRLSNSATKEFKLGTKEAPKRVAKSIESQIKDNLADSAAVEESTQPQNDEVVGEVGVEEDKAENSPSEATVEIPDDYADLSWPKLRSLAANFTDEKGINKERALEILATAKGE